MPFWLKSQEELQFTEDEKAIQAFVVKEMKVRQGKISRLIYEMMNMSGDVNGITVIDLV